MGRRSKKISNIEDANGNTIDGTYSFEYDNDEKSLESHNIHQAEIFLLEVIKHLLIQAVIFLRTW